jgi:hypothetical protein
MAPEPYVSARVVAEHLDIQRRQVLAMTREGKLPGTSYRPRRDSEAVALQVVRG